MDVRSILMKASSNGCWAPASFLETIPDAPYGDDSAGMVGVWFDLLPKPPDMDRYGVITP
jgi:hypothetical protein